MGQVAVPLIEVHLPNHPILTAESNWELEITLVNLKFFQRKSVLCSIVYASCNARRAVSENLGPRPQNRLWAV